MPADLNVEVLDRGPFHLVERVEGARHIFISFAPVHFPADTYVNRKVLAAEKAHRLYFNCADSQWYLGGVEGFAEGIERTAARIRHWVDRLRQDGSKVIAYGGSMGGYGALLYGCLIGADTAIGMGVESELGIVGGASSGHLLGRKNPLDFYEVINAARTECQIFTGEGALSDLHCALLMRSRCRRSGMRFRTVRGLMHPLPNYLHAKYGLENFFRSAVNGDMFEMDDADTGNILAYPELVHLVYDAQYCLAVDHGRLPALAPRMAEAAARDGIEAEYRSFLFRGLAQIALHEGDLGMALDHARSAYELAPHLLWNVGTLVRAHEANGSADETIRYCEIAAGMQNHGIFLEDTDLYFIHARCLRNQKRDHAEALRQLRRLIGLRPTHEAAWALLQIIYADLQEMAARQDTAALLQAA